jgi:hypothetical protein
MGVFRKTRLARADDGTFELKRNWLPWRKEKLLITVDESDGTTQVYHIDSRGRQRPRSGRDNLLVQRDADEDLDAGIIDEVQSKRRWWKFWKRPTSESRRITRAWDDNPLRAYKLKRGP